MYGNALCVYFYGHVPFKIAAARRLQAVGHNAVIHLPAEGFSVLGNAGSADKKVKGHIRNRCPVAGSVYSAVVGSITVITSLTEFAGKPPCFACSLTISSLGAIYTQ